MTELKEETRIYLAPVDTPIPDLRDSTTFGPGWAALTVTDLLRQDPAGQVRVTLTDSADHIIATYEAAAARPQPATKSDDNTLHWTVVVAGSALFRFALNVEDSHITGTQFLGYEPSDSTNELLLASKRFEIELCTATKLALHVQDLHLFTLGLDNSHGPNRAQLEAIAETLDDLVAIERLSGHTTAACKSFDDRDRVALRQLRLMWEGNTVLGPRGPLSTTTTTGKPPEVVAAPPTTLTVGETEVPVLLTLIRHPDMESVEVRDATVAGEGIKRFRVAAPAGERFTTWFPERIAVEGDDALRTPARWNLTEIDEDAWPA